MNIFKLPDLGEGLPDAEIHEWFVAVGDTVKADQPMVSMETAKAVVDVPCPHDGVISRLYGKPGDVIKTGEPLVAFESDSASTRADKGTVVGNLEESHEVSEDNFTIGASGARAKATAGVRMLAKKHGVELSSLKGSGEHGVITREDVELEISRRNTPPHGFEPLRGVRRAMLSSMTQSHREVVPVSIFDEADIHAWKNGTDITVRLIRAITHAAKVEPALNAWYDTAHSARRCFEEVHLGLAMDNDEGLFVPVIHDAGTKTDAALRETINGFKKSVSERSVPAEQLRGATFTLSNFGKFSGKFASPIIVPPMVAILAVGKLYEGAVVRHGQVEIHRLLPLSLSFDHRAITGGEATRFLGAVIEALSAP